MIDRINGAYEAAKHAGRLIVDRAAEVRPGWLAVGMAIYLISQAVRTRGWLTILRASYPADRTLQPWHVVRAYFAGSGLNAVIPARGGDIVKLALVHRHLPGSSYATLVATFVPETLFETFFGVLLVVWALARGFLPIPTSSGEIPSVDVSLLIVHPVTSVAVAAALTLAVVLLLRLLGPRARALGSRMRRGVAILGSPRLFVTGVVSWQALARLIRLAAIAAFMLAFELPVTLSTVVLVMAAQGGGRIIPLAPASTGLRLAMLSYGFVEVTGQAVDIADITAFTFGVGALTALVGIVISIAILITEFGFVRPSRMLTRARGAIPGAPRDAGVDRPA